ncbi:MAG: ATP-binding protein, partial [Bacteroidales bacterium]|nr:ATP-binding protein [Bacteroidales bacterium]
ASEVMELTSEQLASSGASLSFAERSDDVILFADRGQILQILINLVKNAIQAKARTIKMEARIDSSDVTIIEVSNDGEPITPEAQKQMFVPFYTTKQDGSGIGLAISRQIMRMHNGQISLKSSTAEKTTFSLIFR